MRFPRALIRYLFNEFMRSFGLALGGLAILILLGNLFDELSRLVKYDPPPLAVAAYFACRLPYLLSQAVPLAVLVGTLLTVTGMLKSHELTAMRAGGMSQWTIALPFLAPAFVISLLMVLFNETLVPKGNLKAAEIKRVHIRKMEVRDLRMVSRAAIWTADGKLVYAEHVNGEEGILTGVTIAEFYGRKLLGRWDVAQVKPDPGMWTFDRAQVYRWRQGKATLRRYAKTAYPAQEGIGFFLKEDRELKTQTLKELGATIQRLKQSGLPYRDAVVFFHLKWAFPFANVIVALLALGISFRFQTNPREGTAMAFGAAIMSAICYIGLIQFGQALGIGGVLPPIFAMWMANIVFLCIGLWLLRNAWR